MALLSVIRRWHQRDSIAIREIARRSGLSRNDIDAGSGAAGRYHALRYVKGE